MDIFDADFFVIFFSLQKCTIDSHLIRTIAKINSFFELILRKSREINELYRFSMNLNCIFNFRLELAIDDDDGCLSKFQNSR